ncbi:intestinal mucin-like protein [Gouania willdenowi]|uniref:intestinal mucin-like protein n=1 Tax=Gouania willdenowi TaxID=441366 RepID=UPI0010547F91|nr:intestinal mucin-like protein [Gouania willdenowi]
MARCTGNDTLQIIPYECPPITKTACTNGKKQILEWDEFHCCQHPVCECVCEGWGSSHYNTFDGSYYSYKGNCTYVLMEEITPKFNLKIYIDGASCDPKEDSSCSRSISVFYGSLVVRLQNTNLNGASKLEALTNNSVVRLPFSQQGVKVINSGINLILEIPRIEVVIKFGKNGFSVFVPVKTFGRNTQGHCGTCNNIQSDDCRLPGGQLVKSCAVMADYWLVKDSTKPNCKKPLAPPTNILETTTKPVSKGYTRLQTSPQVSQSITTSSTITRTTLQPPGTKTTFETPTTTTQSKSPPTGAKGATETTISSAKTTGLPGITQTQKTESKTTFPKSTGAVKKTTTLQPGERFPTKSTSPGVSLSPESTTQLTSPQESETTPIIESATTIITRSTLPSSGTEATYKAPTTFTGSTSPPTGTKGATETTISSAKTTGLPGITETQKTESKTTFPKSTGAVKKTTTLQPGERFPTKSTSPGVSLSPESTTQRTSPQESETTPIIESATTIITRSTLPSSGTETTFKAPTTFTGSTSPPTGAKGATETTIFSAKTTKLPGITETQKTESKTTLPKSVGTVEKTTTLQAKETSAIKSTSTSSSTRLGSTTAPQVSETVQGSTASSITRSTIAPRGTVTAIVTSATRSTSAPAESEASPETQRTIATTRSGGIPETTTGSITLLPRATFTTKPISSLLPGSTGFTMQQSTPSVSKTTPSKGFTSTRVTELNYRTTLPITGSTTLTVTPNTSTKSSPESTISTETKTTPTPSTAKTIEYSTTEPKPCREDSVCDLLTSEEGPFAECHDSVSPRNFHSSCVSDSCTDSNQAVECESLESYAAACAQAGVCIDWRNYTKLCASDCPLNKVYKPCGPAEQPTCDDNPDEPPTNVTTEGCFCAEGMKLFNKYSDVCVKTCGCLDPENNPHEFNETFEYKCQDCICEKSKTVTCKPRVCPEPENTTCVDKGYVLVNQTSKLDPCCLEHVCQCQVTTCPVPKISCLVGFKPILSVAEGACCPNYTCVPKKVCVHDDAEYQIGATVPGSEECEECLCSRETDSSSGGLLKINCTVKQCNESCELGMKYVQKDTDKCCGKCKPTHCVITDNGTKQLLIEGETWSPPKNKCEVLVCVKTEDTLVIVNSTVPCPHFNESECLPNTTQTAADGCCKTCVEKDKTCKKVSMKIRITHKGCSSNEEVDMPFCEGSCNTFTKYSQAAASLQHSCSCCKELRSSNRTVNLRCLNGETIPHSYQHVEECACNPTECTKAAVAPARRRRSFSLV